MKIAPEHPFSNGTEGQEWMSVWCSWCIRDHVTHMPDGDWSNGCELIAKALVHEPVPEWTDYSEELGFTLPASMTCSKFRECSCNKRKNYPKPPPETPGIPRIYVGNFSVPYQAHVEHAREVRAKAKS